MIAALVLSILSLYPWNINTGGYYTHGRDSEDKRIRIASATIGMDRLNRDAFAFACERRVVELDGDQKLEHDYFAFRGYRWWDRVIRTGVTAGYMDVEQETWFGALQFEGQWQEWGYSLTGILARGGTDVGESPRIFKINPRLSRVFGPHRLWIGYQAEWESLTTRTMASFGASSRVSRYMSFHFEHRFGKSRFLVDPKNLTMDNTPSLVTRQTKLWTSVRLHTNVYLLLKLSRNEQEPWGRWGREWDIRTTYYTAGFLLRL
jgi:hypothetical protein